MQDLLSSIKNYIDNQKSNIGLIKNFNSSYRYFFDPLEEQISNVYKNENICFIYDQALATIAYTILQDFKNSKNILEILNFHFHLDKDDNIGLYTVYFADTFYEDKKTLKKDIDGNKISFYPNIWIGIATCIYTEISKDYTFFKLAIEILKWIINKDQNHMKSFLNDIHFIDINLCYYSLLKKIEKFYITNKSCRLIGEKENLYLDNILDQKILIENWIKTVINHKKINSMQFLNITPFLILSLGIEKIEYLGINFDDFFEQTELYLKTNIEIDDNKYYGFTFPNKKNNSICIDWTYQLILTYKIASNYYLIGENSYLGEKYRNKSKFYFDNVENLIKTLESKNIKGLDVVSNVWRLLGFVSFNPF
jgi:hypothetical protein